jgi:anti-anti-sigma factor
MQVSMMDGALGLSGWLDARAAGAVRDALHAALAEGSGPLVVDLSGVDLVDATGLGVLVGAHRRARLEGRELVLRGTPPRVARLLARTRLHRVLTLEEHRIPA